MRAGLASFQPQAHRGEVVATVDGVPFIDNSKATNVHAAMAAIERVERAVLIAGGRAKGVDLSPLAEAASNLSAVVAIGEAAPELLALFEASSRRREPIRSRSRDRESVRPRPNRGGPVLLAPACASWDQFTGYAERGDRFAAAARSLQEVAARGGA